MSVQLRAAAVSREVVQRSKTGLCFAAKRPEADRKAAGKKAAATRAKNQNGGENKVRRCATWKAIACRHFDAK